MSECKFAVEAFHAYIESIGLSRPAGTLGELKAFKAGAEWQRSLAQAELAELKAELALALKVPSIAAMHTWLDSECAKKSKQLETEFAALKEIPEQAEIAGYKASDGSLMRADNAELVALLEKVAHELQHIDYTNELVEPINMVLAKHRGEK